MSRFAHAVAAAFDRNNPAATVDALKQTVIREIRQTDTRVEVKKTDYFNHSFSPDLVLHWPSSDLDRFVFLRTDPNPDYLAEDILLNRERHPIIFMVNSGVPSEDSESGVARLSRENDVLLTDAWGIAEFAERRANAPVVELASSAILQGGRGLVPQTAAATLADEVISGYNGARQLHTEATLRAAQVINGAFDETRASRLKGFLQAVWTGSGGSPTSFPGGNGLSPLDDNSLSFLLRLADIDDDGFWRRIGSDISLERLARLDVDHPSSNFQRLVSNNVDRITARTCRIIPDQLQPGEDTSGFHWTVYRGMLALRDERATAVLAQSIEDVNFQGVSPSDGISIGELIARTTSHDIPVGHLEFATPRRTVSYGAETSEDVSHDTELLELSDVFGPAVRVRSSIATMPGKRSLKCDFTSMTASSRSSAKFAISDLLKTSLALLLDLSEDDLTWLDALARRWNPRGEQQALFEV